MQCIFFLKVENLLCLFHGAQNKNQFEDLLPNYIKYEKINPDFEITFPEVKQLKLNNALFSVITALRKILLKHK